MRKAITNIRRATFLLFSAVMLVMCSRSNRAVDNQKQLLPNNYITIYCENSMVPFLLDIKEPFEQKYQCKVKLVNDCSQNLIGLINYSKQGDLFIPDSYSALSSLNKLSAINITDSAFVGYNRLIMMVSKSNPLQFNGDLTQLTDSGISIVLANPETSSLGLQTKQMLTKYGLYDHVIKNVVSLSVDSKGLLKSVANGEADLAITWESDMFQNNNNALIDSVLVTNEYASEVYAGILSCTQNPTFAKYFIDFVSSNDGSTFAKKYGFNKRKPHIF